MGNVKEGLFEEGAIFCTEGNFSRVRWGISGGGELSVMHVQIAVQDYKSVCPQYTRDRQTAFDRLYTIS